MSLLKGAMFIDFWLFFWLRIFNNWENESVLHGNFYVFDFWIGGLGFSPLFQMLKFCSPCVFPDFFISALFRDVVQICFRLGRLCFYKLKVSHQLVMANIEPSQSLTCNVAHLGDCDELFFPFSLNPWCCFRKHKSLLCPKVLRVNLMHISQYECLN